MVKRDKLNTNSFTTEKGKNYRQARTVELSELSQYFSKKGFKVIDLQQLWRHAHGKLKKDNKTFFLKVASTPDIGERTQNEVSWNQQIHNLIVKSNINYFDVPEIYEFGEYEGKFYYLSSYHDGSLLASQNPPNTEGLDQWLDKILKSNLFFSFIAKTGFTFTKRPNFYKFYRETGKDSKLVSRS